jgi:hypothetical protein
MMTDTNTNDDLVVSCAYALGHLGAPWAILSLQYNVSGSIYSAILYDFVLADTLISLGQESEPPCPRGSLMCA